MNAINCSERRGERPAGAADRQVGGPGAGRHAVDLAEGRQLPPGLYLVRLTQGVHSRVVRTAVLRSGILRAYRAAT